MVDTLCYLKMRDQLSPELHNHHCVLAARKGFSGGLGKQVVDAQTGKDYKTIFKEFELHQSTFVEIVHKQRKFKGIVILPGGSANKDCCKSRKCNHL